MAMQELYLIIIQLDPTFESNFLSPRLHLTLSTRCLVNELIYFQSMSPDLLFASFNGSALYFQGSTELLPIEILVK